jgi:L-lactate dehydrogenase complex protein LldF
VRNGGQVHFAPTARGRGESSSTSPPRRKRTRCIKKQVDGHEEINLAHALELAGMDVVETDLGEFIVSDQPRQAVHLVPRSCTRTRRSIAKLFSEYFGTPYNDDPQSLTMQAAQYLRDKFRTSDFGMTGGNFLVAETGQSAASRTKATSGRASPRRACS